MKHVFLFLFILFFVCTSCSDNSETEKKSDLDKYDLKGNVKSFRQLPYYAIMNMGYVLKSKPGTDVFLWTDYGLSVVFDKKGRTLEKTSYKKDNTIGCTTYYKYDADSLIITSIAKDFIGKCFVQKYNRNKDLIEEYELDGDNRSNQKNYIYSLDDRGNKIEKIILDSDVRVVSRFLYKYNENNLLIEECSFLNNMIIKTTYDYNNKNQLTQECKFGEFITYKYDNSGLLISKKSLPGPFEEFVYNETHKLIKSKISNSTSIGNVRKEYEYDIYENWIKCVVYIDSKITSLMEREIVYF